MQDCAFFEGALTQDESAEQAARDLAGQPLWRSQSMPSDFAKLWKELQSFLLNEGDDWQVWKVWYQARLDGGKTINVPDDLLERVDVGIATLDEALWRKGPAAVNAEIKRLMDGGDPTIKLNDAAKHQALEELKFQVDELFKDHSDKFAAQINKTTSEQGEIFSKELNERLQEHYKLILTKAGEAANAGVVNIQDTAKNALAGVRSEKIFQDSFKLWEEKKASHRRNFWCGAGLFVALIVASSVTMWLNFDDIKILITEVAPSGKANGSEISYTALLFSRFLIITLPAAIVIWILRAVLRFANLNLSLAEDAAQREVMAQTYVNLLADGQLTEKEDRQLMLSALFRPLPGIQEIDAAPTTIIDISNPTKSKSK